MQLTLPVVILNLKFCGTTIAQTSDFIVDCLSHWWPLHQADYTHLDELMIDLDGGSATRSDRNRTQFTKPMVEFAQTTHLKIYLVYYPPDHSKCNPIKQCWAALENYWNGTVLDSIEAATQWAAHMTWKGIAPIVHRLDTIYEKGIKVSLAQLEESYLPFWQRSETLPKWDIMIEPT